MDTTEHTPSPQGLQPSRWCVVKALLLALGILLAGASPAFAQDNSWIATTWWGAWGAPRAYTTATCRTTGPEAIWIAQTGTAFLDIIQVGTVNGHFFYAYGRGVPNGPGSLYVEKHLGLSGAGNHTYGLRLATRVWTLTIDGRVVARISDAFRTWKVRETQIMSEGDLPMGPAYCRFPGTGWNFGGYGPQPPQGLGANWWSVTR